MKFLAASKNGQPVKEEEVLPYLDRTLSREGVYEAVQTYYGRPFRLGKHLERLKQSALDKGLALPRTIAEIHTLCEQVIKDAGENNQFLFISVDVDDVVIVSGLLERDRDLELRGYNVKTVTPARVMPGTKSLEARTESSKLQTKAKADHYDDVILIDKDGNCAEGAYANLFWINEGVVYTNTKNALHGITQAAIIEAIGKKYTVRISTISREDITDQDEVFFTSSRIGVMPVVNIDDKDIGDGIPGTETKKIMNLFEDLTDKECSV